MVGFSETSAVAGEPVAENLRVTPRALVKPLAVRGEGSRIVSGVAPGAGGVVSRLMLWVLTALTFPAASRRRTETCLVGESPVVRIHATLGSNGSQTAPV